MKSKKIVELPKGKMNKDLNKKEVLVSDNILNNNFAQLQALGKMYEQNKGKKIGN